jgi:hypothetical protein
MKQISSESVQCQDQTHLPRRTISNIEFLRKGFVSFRWKCCSLLQNEMTTWGSSHTGSAVSKYLTSLRYITTGIALKSLILIATAARMVLPLEKKHGDLGMIESRYSVPDAMLFGFVMPLVLKRHGKNTNVCYNEFEEGTMISHSNRCCYCYCYYCRFVCVSCSPLYRSLKVKVNIALALLLPPFSYSDQSLPLLLPSSDK